MNNLDRIILTGVFFVLTGCAAMYEIVHWNDGPTGAEMEERVKQCREKLRGMHTGTWEYQRQKELCKELELRR